MDGLGVVVGDGVGVLVVLATLEGWGSDNLILSGMSPMSVNPSVSALKSLF